MFCFSFLLLFKKGKNLGFKCFYKLLKKNLNNKITYGRVHRNKDCTFFLQITKNHMKNKNTYGKVHR
jgi:hypothetical protein